MTAVVQYDTELELARRLDRLHQLLYRRGGIRPANAAIEELSKLLLIEIAANEFPDAVIGTHGTLEEVVNASPVSVAAAKCAFTEVVSFPTLVGKLPTGELSVEDTERIAAAQARLTPEQRRANKAFLDATPEERRRAIEKRNPTPWITPRSTLGTCRCNASSGKRNDGSHDRLNSQ